MRAGEEGWEGDEEGGDIHHDGQCGGGRRAEEKGGEQEWARFGWSAIGGIEGGEVFTILKWSSGGRSRLLKEISGKRDSKGL